MAREQTDEQAKQEHIKLFGQKLGTLYHGLESELTWLMRSGSSSGACSLNQRSASIS